MLNDVYSRDMTHKLEECIVQGDRVAFSESCQYPDGVRVLAESMLSLHERQDHPADHGSRHGTNSEKGAEGPDHHSSELDLLGQRGPGWPR